MSTVVPCREFAQGHCIKGDRCRYDHVLIDCVAAHGQFLSRQEVSQISSLLQTELRSKIYETEYHCTRYLGGGIAIFGPGAECRLFRPIRLSSGGPKYLADPSADTPRKEPSVKFILLSPTQTIAALTGGYKAIVRHLGKDHACLDLTATPRCIRIYGSEKDLEEAKDVLERSVQVNNEDHCSLCYYTSSSSTFTVCGHRYCIECFEGLCLQDFSRPLRCCWNGEKPCKLLSLIEMQAHLSQEDFEKILMRSFDWHISRNDMLFYCPTPDCAQVHQVNDGSTVCICQTCSQPICRRCKTAAHAGISCEEHQTLLQRQNASWKEEHDIKGCPKCGALIQKWEGCNHFQCDRCAVHFCWLCLAIFPHASEVYEHFRADGCETRTGVVEIEEEEEIENTDEDVDEVDYGVVHLPEAGFVQEGEENDEGLN